MAALFLGVLASPAAAQIRTLSESAAPGTVPGNVNYQGRLQDGGLPANGTYSMTFRLYNVSSGGTAIVTLGPQSVTVTQGVFGTTLALSTTTLAGATQKYLEVQVGSTVLAPREPLNAVPYALIAKSLEDSVSIGTASVTGILFSSGTLKVASMAAIDGNSGIFISSSVFISPGSLGIGTTSPAARLHLSGGDLQIGDAPTASTISASGFMTLPGISAPGASKGRLYFDPSANSGQGALKVSLDGASFVPLSTGVAGGGISSVAADAAEFSGDGNGIALALRSSSVTLQGNAFNGASQLVKLDASGKLPAVDGSLLTGVPASGSVAKIGDTMTGQLTLAGSTLTVSGNAFSVGGSTLAVSSGRLGVGTTSPGAVVEIVGTTGGFGDGELLIRDLPGGNYMQLTGNAGGGQPGLLSSTGFLDAGGVIFGGASSSNSPALRARGTASASLVQSWESFAGASLVVVSTGGQVGVGTTAPNASAALELVSTTRGLLPPRLTSAQRDAITSPAQGLLFFNTSTNRLTVSTASAVGSWVEFTTGSALTGSFVSSLGDTMTGQLTLANSTLTVTGSAFSVGASTLAVSAGRVGVGTASPAARLHVSGGDLQVGDAPTASTISASGFMTLANLSAAPSASRGRVFFDPTANGSQGALKISLDGVSFVPISTGAAGAGISAVASNSSQFSGDGNGTALALKSSSVTLQGNSFNASNRLVLLDGFGRYPALDGSQITNLASNDSTKVAKAGDGMSGPLTLVGSTLTVTGNAFSVAGATFTVSGGRVGIGTSQPGGRLVVKEAGSNLAGNSLKIEQGDSTVGYHLTSNASHLFLTYDDGAGTLADRLIMSSSGNLGVGTTSPAGRLHVSGGDVQVGDLTASTVSASGYVTLANLSSPPAQAAKGRLYFDPTANSNQGALKISLDGSSFVPLSTGVAGGGITSVTSSASQFSGDGSSGNALTLRSSSVTLQGNAFNVANTLVKLDSSGKLPAIDGSQLTGVSGSNSVARTGDTMTGQLTLAGSSLTVAGAAGIGAAGLANGTLVVRSTSTTSANPVLALQANSGTVLMRVQQDGKVGLGSSAPSALLHVSGGDVQVGDVTASTLSASGFLTLANLSGASTPGGAKGRIYFDPTANSNHGALEVSLDGTSFVPISTGVAGSGLSSVAVNGSQMTGDGNSGTPLSLKSSSVTLQGNLFNTANALVRLDSIGRMPAVDGSLITNITSSDSNRVAKAGDTMTGQLTLAGSTLTVQGNAFSVGTSTFVVSAGRVGIGTSGPLLVPLSLAAADGGLAFQLASTGGSSRLTVGTDGSGNVQFRTQNAADLRLGSATDMFSVRGNSGDVGIGTTNPLGRLHVSGGDLVVGDAPVSSTMSASGFLTLASLGSAPSAPAGTLYYDSSSNKLRLQNGAGFVDISTGSGNLSLVYSNPSQFSGDGTIANPLTMVSSSVTLQGNSFNAANRLVQLDGSGRLPAIDGSQLTNISGGNSVSRTGDTMTGQLTLANSTLTVTGDAFSVARSTLAVASGYVGVGTSAPAANLDLLAPSAGVGGANAGGLMLRVMDGLSRVALGVYGGIDGIGLPDSSATALAVREASGTGRSITTSGTIYAGSANGAVQSMIAVGDVQFGASTTASTFSASGYMTLANLSSPPSQAARGRLYFDPTANSNQGALKVSLDGASFVPLSTGVAGGGLSSVASNASQFSGDGSSGNALTLKSSSVTLQGNTFNAASSLVKLDSSGKLPALDGSALTGISATDSSKVAKAGDAMTGQLTIAGSSLTVRSAAASSPLFVSTSPTLGVAGLYVDGTNKVGVGTTSPDTLFNVSMLANGAEAVLGHFRNSGGAGAVATVKVGEGVPETQYGVLGHYGVDNSFRVGNIGPSGNNGYLSLHVGVTASGTTLDSTNEKMRIMPSGNVGVGTTSPAALLHVSGGDVQVGDVNASTISASGFMTLARLSSAPGASRGRLYFDPTANSNQGALKVSLDGTSFVPISTGTAGGGISAVVSNSSQFSGDGNGVALTLKSSSVTLQGNTFNAANSLVLLDGSGKLPAIDGSQLTNVSGSNAVAKTGDTMTGQLTLSGSSLTVRSNAAISPLLVSTSATAGSAALYVDGSANVGVGTTAPFQKLHVSTGNFLVDGNAQSLNGPRLNVSDVWTHGSFGPPSASTQYAAKIVRSVGVSIGPANQWTDVGLYIDVTGMALNKYGLIVNNGFVGIGTQTPSTTLHVAGDAQVGGATASTISASGFMTLANLSSPPSQAARGRIYFDPTANSNQGALKVSLDGTSFVPLSTGTAGGGISAVSSNASQFSGDGNGTALTLKSSSVTLQGNAFNGANQLVQLDGSGKLPAIDGSQLTGISGGGGGSSVAKAGDVMTGALAIRNSSLTVNGAIFSTGTSGGTPFSGAGTRFMWIPSSASIRAGQLVTLTTRWDPANIGPLSVAFGQDNLASGTSSTVSGGSTNQATGSNSTVGGGSGNSALNTNVTIAGGASNLANGVYAAIGGGVNNQAGGNGSTVAGGENNSTAGFGGAVGGGQYNLASGNNAVVPGGLANLAAGDQSFAGGYGSTASARGSFVWSDSQGVGLLGSTTDQFLVRAQGGFYVDASSASFGPGAVRSTFSVGGLALANLSTPPSQVVKGQIYFDPTANSSQGALKVSLDGSSFVPLSTGTAGGGISAVVSNSSQFSGDGNGTALALKSSSVTLQGNTFNGASQLVQLDSSGKLPAVDGSQLTGISGGGSSVAKAGDVMTGALAIRNSSLTVNGAIYSTGTIGGAAFTGTGTRFMWIPSSAAIRAGFLDSTASTAWDPANIGGQSVAFGYDSTASGAWSTVAGGFQNTASANAWSTVGGGSRNTASGAGSTVVGGETNTASGVASTVLGGLLNAATGDFSTAAGNRAQATAQGSFVWADSQSSFLTGNTTDQFLVRSQGGFYVDASSSSFGAGSSRSTFSASGLALAQNADLTLSGSSGLFVSASSVTASAFFGDGSHLTGISGGGNSVSKTGDTMSGSLSIYNSTLTVNGPIFSTGTSGGAAFAGAGTRFMWIPASASIRAGLVSGTAWDGANIGLQSVAFGQDNTASGANSAVGGGLSNTASATAASVGGGNSNTASGLQSFVGAGQNNSATAANATIGGGNNNVTSNGADESTIAGGKNNNVSSLQAAIGGGINNIASGLRSTVPGGIANVASGDRSFAAGNRAKASAQGSFVWADSQAADLLGSTTDQFLVRSQGGFYVDASSASFGTGAVRSTFSIGGLALANLSTPPSQVVKGQIYFDPTANSNQGALKVSLDGSSFVNLSTGTAGGGITAVVSNSSQFSGDGNGTALALKSSSVTLQGNTFNGASQLVQLDAAGKLAVAGNAFSVGASTLVVSGGSVGIGTSSPDAELHVSKTGATSSDVLLTVSSGTATGQELLVVKGDGGVGIGTTSPAEVLHLRSNVSGGPTAIRLEQRAGGGWWDAFIASDQRFGLRNASLLDAITIFADNRVSIGGSDAARLFVSSSGATSSDFVLLVSSGNATDQALFAVKGDGKVGVGTTSPAATLDVRGEVVGTSSVTASAFFGDGSHLTGISGGGGGWTQTGTVVSLQTPSNAVVVQSSLTVAGAAGIGGSGLSNGTLVVRSTSTTSATPVIAAQTNGGTELMRVEQGGNVGIGATAPNLHAYGNTGGLLTVQNLPSTSFQGVLELANRTDADQQPIGDIAFSAASQTGAADLRSAMIRAVLSGTNANNRGSAITFHTRLDGGGNDIEEQVRIDPSGRMGIGTSAPSALLHVSGGDIQVGDATASTISASGFMTFANLGSVPALSTGRVYYDQALKKLRLDNGLGSYVDIATGTIPSSLGSGVFVARSGDSMTGQLTVGSSVTIVNTSSTDSYSLAVTTVPDRSGYHLCVSTYGYVGIGTCTPGAKLEVDGSAALLDNGTNANASSIGFVKLRGQTGSVQTSDTLGSIGFLGLTGFSVSQLVSLGAQVEATSPGYSGNFAILTKGTSDGTTVERMRITGPGRVGIGNTNPSAGLHLSKISGTSDVNTMTIDGANTVNGQNHTGLFVNPSQTASNASAVYGIFAQPAVSANTGTTSNLVGVAGEPSASGVGGTVSIMYGGLFEPQITAGTVSNAIGVYAGGTAGSATTAFGLQAYGALSGTVTTAYGVYIGAPSGTITTKYSLVTESGSGNVGFGTTSPGAPVHVSGGAGVLLRLQGTSGTCDHTPTSGSETVSCSSDERLKANISDADSVLDEFMKLRVRQYTIKSTGERTVGVIAQEVKKVAPAMVHEEKGGYYKVEQIDPWKLLKAIQELKEENEALKARIDKLEKERR